MPTKHKNVYIVQLNYLVVFCSTNLKASFMQLKDRVHIDDLTELHSYAQLTRILGKNRQYKFSGVGNMFYSILKFPLYTKNSKLIH